MRMRIFRFMLGFDLALLTAFIAARVLEFRGIELGHPDFAWYWLTVCGSYGLLTYAIADHLCEWWTDHGRRRTNDFLIAHRRTFVRSQLTALDDA